MEPAALAQPTPKVLLDLAAVVENMGIAYVCDRQGRLVGASTGYRELMGLAADAPALPARHYTLCSAAMMAGQPLEGLERIGRGIAARQLLVRHLPVGDAGGGTAGALGLLCDAGPVTEGDDTPSRDRRRLQDFIRASVDWVWETDRRGALSFVSDRVIDVLGLPPVLLHGRPLASLGTVGATVPGGVSFAALLDARRPFRDVQITLADKDDNERRFLLNGVPAFDEAGNFTGFRGTASDVSAQHEMATALGAARRQIDEARGDIARLNARLDEAIDRAARAARTKSEFLATMSHELRTPLNAVIGFAELIVGEEVAAETDRHREYAGDIAKAGHHLLRLIDDLLDMARIEETRLRVDTRGQPLRSILLEACSIAQARRHDRDAQISIKVEPEDLSALTDRTRLVQIILNLLDNALRLAPPGSPVEVGAGAEGDTVWIDVADAGPGIPADRRGAIFEAFGRLEPSLIARPTGGLGIGLSIARSLARLMQGDIVLLETGPQGSRFRLTLPRARP